ncbi:hypothetical protein [Acidipila sp. EB88]|uniref:hypothetical protein n=1 Tax=Acidipila sp. EB88 TaxID=2305226 RepID=UPI000F5E5B93|nr:hypothetical protein [Acidipila sp. EB88]RRA49177.1 hypothetical protein D1Y84_13760 [Acidipila sp. EB88]
MPFFSKAAVKQGNSRAHLQMMCMGAALLCVGTMPARALEELPNAPDARALQDAANKPAPGTPAAQGSNPQQAAQPKAQQGSAGDTNYDLKGAEHQRILGIIPEFQAVNHSGAYAPLTVKQKFGLFWKSSTDPYIFTLDAIVAGIGQAKDSNPGYGQGTEGYFKRFGASYADTFDGNFWGNAVLTSALHEDPRYFRKGEDFSPMHRALYSASTAVWARRDSGNWGPNYANILGNIIAGGISNAYYPSSDRGVGKTFTGALTVTAEGTIGSELEEFWPDIAAHFQKKHREKLMRQQAAAASQAAAPKQP